MHERQGLPTGLSAIRFEQVGVWRRTDEGRRDLLRDVDWNVRGGEHWVLLGANGAGKTTLVRIASAQLRPSSGVAWVLGKRLGRTALTEIRREIGVLDPLLARRFYPEQTALDVVLTGATQSILVVEDADAATRDRAHETLALVGARDLAGRHFSVLSEGERARVLLARALVAAPRLLILDEPAAGLDVAGRLLFQHALEQALAARRDLTTVTVTHELHTLPRATTHALLLRAGTVVAQGPVEAVVTAESIAACFDVPLDAAARAL